MSDEKFIPYGLQWLDETDIAAVTSVLEGDWITTGPKIEKFEREICKYVGCKHAVAVNSGTSALDIAVSALGLRDGEIITTPFTFVATANAIIYNGLTPVFSDILPSNFNIDPESIRKKISKSTRAIIYVDYAGHPCDIKEIKEIAEEHDLFLIEDGCHALGAEYDRKKVGCFADTTVFSFHPVKHITTGEGGMAVTDDEELAQKMRMLRNHGIDKEVRKRFGPNASYVYDMKLLGRNYRMTDFQAALGISQLKKLDRFIELRQRIVDTYTKTFKNMPLLTVPKVSNRVRHAWHLYTLLLHERLNRDAFFNVMRERNIGVNVHYIPVSHFSYYREHFHINPKNFPVTENVFSKIITLPLYPRMAEDEVLHVIDIVKNTVKKLADQV